MQPLHRPCAFAIALLVLFGTATAPARAQAGSPVFVVAEAPGPGVDFTDIGTAIISVPVRSVLLIETGTYPGFSVGKSLTLIATGEVQITSTARIQNASGSRVALSGLALDGLEVENCTATILLDSLAIEGNSFNYPDFAFRNNADVRLRASTTQQAGLVVENSHVEVVECVLEGHDGMDVFGDAEPGYPALYVIGASEVTVARSSLRGGEGGDSTVTFGFPGFPGADGGEALAVWNSSTVTVTGRATDVLRGGDGGDAPFSDNDAGDGAYAIQTFGGLANVVVSGVTTVGGDHPDGGSQATHAGNVFPAATTEPSLGVVGGTLAGQPVVFDLQGEPFALHALTLGFTAQVVTVPGIEGDVLHSTEFTFLGLFDGTGASMRTFTVPALPVGFAYYAQLLGNEPVVGLRASNSVGLVVR